VKQSNVILMPLDASSFSWIDSRHISGFNQPRRLFCVC
jgi:hypothetical protein